MDGPDVRTAINARIALYRAKQARRNPYGEDMFNSWDQCQYAVEVLEWLAADLGIETTDPADDEKEQGTNA
jgi:hypothetical protein